MKLSLMLILFQSSGIAFIFKPSGDLFSDRSKVVLLLWILIGIFAS